MPEIGTSGSMSGDGNGALAIGPKRPRPSSTLPPLPTFADAQSRRLPGVLRTRCLSESHTPAQRLGGSFRSGNPAVSAFPERVSRLACTTRVSPRVVQSRELIALLRDRRIHAATLQHVLRWPEARIEDRQNDVMPRSRVRLLATPGCT